MPTLNVTLHDKSYSVNVPEGMLAEAEEFFQKMDRDMDRGWQMSREFIENPDRTQRAQIAAHRLMLAMSTGKEMMVQLMAGYILARVPGVSGIIVDTDGDMLNTEILTSEKTNTMPAPASATTPKTNGINKIEAMKRAGKEVTPVYKVGKSFRYAVLDTATGQWVESAALDDEKDAQQRRLVAFRKRFGELTGNLD